MVLFRDLNGATSHYLSKVTSVRILTYTSHDLNTFTPVMWNPDRPARSLFAMSTEHK